VAVSDRIAAKHAAGLILAGGASGAPVSFDYTIGTPVTAVDAAVPVAFVVDQDYPNPFNPATTVRCSLAHTGPVELSVYDLLWRRVAVLEEDIRAAGPHQASVDAHA